jgi:hypothetical protein
MRVLSFRQTTKCFLWLALCLVISWCVYLWLGHKLIDLAFDAPDSFLANSLMAERHSTPRQRYHRQADIFMVQATLLAISTFCAVALLLNNARGTLLFILSFLFSTFVSFFVFETFPSLISLARLDQVLGYYAYKVNYIPDPELIFREKPFNRRVIRNFTGTGFAPFYRIQVQPYTIEWSMDRDGFRNQAADDSADIVVLGDSYIEYGANEADTFVGRLQQKLGPLRVRNLGKSGYSIAQYVHTLRRFGLQYKPRLAVMAVYEGNDIRELRDYLLWKSGRSEELAGQIIKFNTDSLLRRYRAAVTATAIELTKRVDGLEEMVLARLASMRDPSLQIHPDVAMLELNGRSYPKVFIDKLPATASAQMLASEEFRAMRTLLTQFNDICRSHDIVPLVLYIPTAAQIYAQYSTAQSGSHWRDIREWQIAVRQNTEAAVRLTVEQAGLKFVSLSPVFAKAAAEGRMLYYPLDAHWNVEGREVAAQFVADILKQGYLATLETAPRP